MKFLKFKLVLLSVLFIISGCASFQNEELSRVSELPDVSQYKSKPSVYVKFDFFRGLPNENPVKVELGRDKVEAVVRNALENSDLFESYSFNESDKITADYTININIYNHGNVVAATVSGFISGFTFGVIPGAATDNFTLEMEALDKNGNKLSQFSNKDSMKTWIGLWFIPAMGNTPQKAMSETLENQVLSALKELIDSGVMKYSYNSYLLNRS